MKDYELIEHTADVGIRVKAKDLEGLFTNAALAMFDIIAEEIRPSAAEKKKVLIIQEAYDLDELFINWLNELLSLSSAKELIFSEFKFKKIDEFNLEVMALARDMKEYKVNTEIKAATYHELKIEQNDSGWQAEVIFDV